jgi:hypothetical protein
MAAVLEQTCTASNLAGDDLVSLSRLLVRKVKNIPTYMIHKLTVDDILLQSPHAIHTPSVPAGIQLSFFFRNRASIDRHDGCPIKDENEQSLDITRAIFFYQLDEAHQFQRYHDTSRWNLAFFTALLCLPAPASPVHSSQNSLVHIPEAKQITPAAQRFMTSYLAAVMERHNTPTVFDKREEFVRRWKDSKYDLFQGFAAGQKKLLKKEMKRLNMEWEIELDVALGELGRREYDACVAPLVGCLVPGRKDQGIHRGHLASVTRPASPPPDAMNTEIGEGKNELLEALRVPLDVEVQEQERGQQDGYRYEDAMTPVELSYAIASLQKVRPVDMLRDLMRLFPGAEGGADVETRDINLPEYSVL